MTTGHHERGAGDPPAGGRRVELLGLLGLSRRLLAATDPSAAAQALLESVVGLYGFPRAVLLSARGDRLTVFASHGMTAGAALGPEGSQSCGEPSRHGVCDPVAASA